MRSTLVLSRIIKKKEVSGMCNLETLFSWKLMAASTKVFVKFCLTYFRVKSLLSFVRCWFAIAIVKPSYSHFVHSIPLDFTCDAMFGNLNYRNLK